MPLNETSGNLTTDAFGGGVAVVPTYIEDVFSTWLYTGTGALQTITNNIDLSTKGGLVWLKSRSTTYNNYLQDTTRGIKNSLVSNDTSAQSVGNDIVDSVSTSGFVVQSYSGGNNSGSTYASWTFRKQPKFFDVVTYTGTGSNRTISHSLGSVPGCIIVKRTDTTGDWQVYHNSLTSAAYSIQLNLTAAQASATTVWNSTAPTSSVFSVGTSTDVNANAGTYVAYIYAHNAGGFGLTGTDNVISCGSFVSDSSASATVNLGYEPQWVIVKRTDSAGGWFLFDVMRGMSNTDSLFLYANNSTAESSYGIPIVIPTATGFNVTSGTLASGAGQTFIYIAIRRGPMKVPTDATKVYNGIARDGTGSSTTITGVGFPPDWVHAKSRTLTKQNLVIDRLRGGAKNLLTDDTTSEQTSQTATAFNQDGITVGADAEYAGINALSGYPYINHFFRRAPSFFDEVCYTGNDTGTRILDHNLTVTPELIIVKKRSGVLGWAVQASTFTADNILFLNTTAALTSTASYLSYPEQNTSTTFKVRYNLNVASDTYVAYLFATCAGVSKVGSYTGNGTTQTINCGFTGGARFVLIKRTDSTGGWYVYDTARGMTTLTDPYLFLNSTAAETATLGSVTTATTGFALNSAILAAINTSSATYIFFAVA